MSFCFIRDLVFFASLFSFDSAVSASFGVGPLPDLFDLSYACSLVEFRLSDLDEYELI